MFKIAEEIEYALPEKIGNPDLFVGKKEGELEVIPFYYSIKDSKQTQRNFAIDFFTEFVKAYISYKTKDKVLLIKNLTFKELKNLIEDKNLKEFYKTMEAYVEEDNWFFMWTLASEAPSTIGRLNGVKIVQIIDEFQYINEYIYDKNEKKLDGLRGTYMHVSELREAPLIISGSEVHWLLKIVRSLTGRFQTYNLENLPKNEAEEATERYALFMRTKINENSKEKIWELTRGDPLYIKALFMSRYNKKKDYTVDENIVEVYEKEISEGEIYTTWMIYMLNTFDIVNKVNSKRIMLYLFNQSKERTRAEIIKDLKLNYSDEEAEEKLNALIAGDLISQGRSAYDYTITRDKTYEMVFRKVYQKEIEHFVPDIQAEIRKIIGKDNYTKEKFTEFLIRERFKKPFNLKDICEPEKDVRLIPKEIKEREFVSFGLKKYEIDLIIKCQKKREIWVDCKNTKNRYGKNEMKRWLRIMEAVREKNKNILFMVYSENGYTKDTKETLIENGVYILK
jgi:hypothetical protein